MKIKGLVDEDVVNYKKTSMYIVFPQCNGFKCGSKFCQNSALAKEPVIEVDIDDLLKRYTDNPLTEAVVCAGLEPFDTFDSLFWFIVRFRYSVGDDDIVIYTGYDKSEIESEVDELAQYKNIIIKFGRYIPDKDHHFDDILGVELASPNQYAEKIS